MKKIVQPVERIHNFRCPDRLWYLTMKKVKEDGTSVSEVIRAALTEYVTK